MAQTRLKAKGRRESGPFVPFPCSVLRSDNFVSMSKNGKAMLFDLCEQLRFKNGGASNNGDLCAAPIIMKKRGWNSNEAISFALQELLYYEFIILTRRGDRRRPHLYGITWWAINECHGKLDSGMENNIPDNGWKNIKPKWKRPKRKKKAEIKLKSVPRFAENKPRITGDNFQ